MAVSTIGLCSAHYCAPQSNRIEPRQKTSWVTQINDWKKVSKEIFFQMRAVLNVELTVRGFSSTEDLPVWTVLQTGNKTVQKYLSEIAEALNQCIEYDIENENVEAEITDWSSQYAVGNKVTNALLESFRKTANDLQGTCICNAAYCTCNCNFCGSNYNTDLTCIAFGATLDQEQGIVDANQAYLLNYDRNDVYYPF